MEAVAILLLLLAGFAMTVRALNLQTAAMKSSSDLDTMLKALDRPSKPADRHFLLLGIVEHAYRRRKSDPRMATLCVQVGRQHVKEFPDLAGPLQRRLGGIMPRVPTFQYLATVLAEAGMFEEAISVCETALEYGLDDGTKGGFEGRIQRIKKKQRVSQEASCSNCRPVA